MRPITGWGSARHSAADPDAALRAFARLPEGYAFDPIGAYHEAKANLTQGKLHAAERRLEQALARGGPGLDQVRDLLGHIYQIEVRFDDVKALLRASLADAKDPIRVLKELSNLELDRLPYDGLQAALEKAGQLAPEDDRVWLGKARLAIEAGRWDEAREWLERCRGGRADAPVWRAWIELARGSGRPDEALDAARQLGPGQLDVGERLALRGVVARTTRAIRGRSRRPSSDGSGLNPRRRRALERLAELAQRAGQSDRVADLRRRKAEVERALEAYRLLLWRDEPLRGAAERYELARRAEAAGRRPEARALYPWALAADPELPAGPRGPGPTRSGRRRATASTSPRTTSHGRVPRSWHARIARNRGPGPSADFPSPTMPRPPACDSSTTMPRRPSTNCPSPSAAAWRSWTTTATAGSTSTASRAAPSHRPPSSSPRHRTRAIGYFTIGATARFEDVTDASGIGRFPRGHGHGVAVGDVDGDGHPDLFVTRWRSYALYRNKGDGTFEDVTTRAGLGGDRDWPTSAALADLDGDGDLDLYVCHYAAWDIENPRLCRNNANNAYLNCNPLDSEALPDHLFRNDAGRFVDVTTEAGIVDRDGRGLGVVAADLDDDGRVDLFVANDSSANFLFRNLGGMRFEEVGHAAGVAGNASGAYQAGMGVAAGDLDGDGLIDLAVTNFYGESTTFYRNLGGGNFTDATAAVGLAVASRRLLGFGVALFDADNDGRLDLASANGHVNDLRPNYPYQMPAQLLIGGADGRLTDCLRPGRPALDGPADGPRPGGRRSRQ